MIEVSRDRSSSFTVPISPPLNCSGMSTINISLKRPEVAQTVLIRLFKPKDSSNLGLSQIQMLGFTTFSEAAYEGLSQTDTSAKSLEAGCLWMLLLEQAISLSVKNEKLQKRIIETAVEFPDILDSCYSILMAPVLHGNRSQQFPPHAASTVLFNFGSFKREVSEQLLAALIGPVHSGFSNGKVMWDFLSLTFYKYALK